MVLASITGEMLVDEACDELDLGPTQFANLRRQVLLAGLEALQPRPVGRPRRAADVTPEQVQAMRQRIAELERDLTLLRSRLELSILPLLEGPRRSKSRRRDKPGADGPRTAPAP